MSVLPFYTNILSNDFLIKYKSYLLLADLMYLPLSDLHAQINDERMSLGDSQNYSVKMNNKNELHKDFLILF